MPTPPVVQSTAVFPRTLLVGLILVVVSASSLAQSTRPKVCVFPVTGDADAALRERTAFALRSKLNREGVYEAIDGIRMDEVVVDFAKAVTLDTPAADVSGLAKAEGARLAIWGDVSGPKGAQQLKLRVLDVETGKVRDVVQKVAKPTDLRFAIEGVLEGLPGMKPFEHPLEEAIVRDAASEKLWKEGPNLVPNSSFSAKGGWTALLGPEKYVAPDADKLPAVDKVVILRGKPDADVLAMNLSRGCAESYGLAALSEPVPIRDGQRYRLSFRYRSEGPKLHVFVKGYTKLPGPDGKPMEREIYRRQVPPTGKTDGWVTIEDELNPQHVSYRVDYLRVDLYTYLSPGLVFFDDIVLKEVGPLARKAKDEALDAPVTRPASR